MQKQLSGLAKPSLFLEHCWQKVFETTQDGILIFNSSTGEMLAINSSLLKTTGYAEKEIVGSGFQERGIFTDKNDSKLDINLLQKQRNFIYDLQLHKKNGSVLDVEFAGNNFIVDNLNLIQCNVRDITKRKAAEVSTQTKTKSIEKKSEFQDVTRRAILNVMDDLKEAKKIIEIEKAKDEAMLGSIADGLIAVDINCKVVMINKSAENITGWKSNELFEKEIIDLHLEDESGQALVSNKRQIDKVLASGKTLYDDCILVNKDGLHIPVAITVIPVLLEGKIIGVLDVFRDVTKAKLADRLKSEFVSIVSHQLRTPLGIIKWYLEIIENEDYFDKMPLKLRNYFDQIEKSNERVLSIVRDLLSVSRMEQGKLRNITKNVSLREEILRIIDQMQISARKKQIKLTLVVNEKELLAVDIDVVRFHEVIENLINNALEYTPARGQVIVTLTKDRSIIFISVKDTGIGISEADQKKLFTKFFRSENAIKYKPDGSGLGLYVAKSYVNDWGGKITIESKEGKGAEFLISIPYLK